MNSCQPQPYADGDHAALHLHVLLVSHCQDDDEEHGRAQHLVHGQAEGGHLLQLKERIGGKDTLCGAAVACGVSLVELHLDIDELVSELSGYIISTHHSDKISILSPQYQAS